MDAARLRISRQLDARHHSRAAAAVDRGRAGRRRCRRDEGRVRTQPPTPAGGLWPGAAHRLRQRREPAARASGLAPDADGGAPRHRRHPDADRGPGAGRERAAVGGRRGRRPGRRDGRRAAAARAGVFARAVPADQHDALAAGAGVRVRGGAADRGRVRRRSRLAGHAHQSGRGAARIGPQHRRSLVVGADGAADRAGHVVGRAGGRRDDAGEEPEQARTPGLRLSAAEARRRVDQPAADDLYPAEAGGAVSPARGSAEPPAWSGRVGARALQPAHRQLGRDGAGRGAPAAEAGRAGRVVVGSRQRLLSPELRHDDDAGKGVHAKPTTRRPRRWRSSTSRS